MSRLAQPALVPLVGDVPPRNVTRAANKKASHGLVLNALAQGVQVRRERPLRARRAGGLIAVRREGPVVARQYPGPVRARCASQASLALRGGAVREGAGGAGRTPRLATGRVGGHRPDGALLAHPLPRLVLVRTGVAFFPHLFSVACKPYGAIGAAGLRAFLVDIPPIRAFVAVYVRLVVHRCVPVSPDFAGPAQGCPCAWLVVPTMARRSHPSAAVVPRIAQLAPDAHAIWHEHVRPFGAGVAPDETPLLSIRREGIWFAAGPAAALARFGLVLPPLARVVHLPPVASVPGSARRATHSPIPLVSQGAWQAHPCPRRAVLVARIALRNA